MAITSQPVLPSDPARASHYNSLRTDLLTHTHDGADTVGISYANNQYLQGADNTGVKRNLIGIDPSNVVQVGGGLPVNVAGPLTATSGLAVSGGPFTSQQPLAIQPPVPTDAAYTRFVNTGGLGYVGLDNSVASQFGGSIYGLSLYAPASRNLELIPGGTPANRTTIAPTGAATIRGTLSVTGTLTHQASAGFASSNQGTAASQGSFANTGGTAYVGIDNSAGSLLFGAGLGYAAGIAHTGNYPVVLRSAGMNGLLVQPSGRVDHPYGVHVGTGTFNSVATGSYVRFPEGASSIEASTFDGGTHGVNNLIGFLSGAVQVGQTTGSFETRVYGPGSVVINPGNNYNFQPSQFYVAAAGVSLGTTTWRWAAVWCTSGAFNGSHSSLKRDWAPLSPADARAVARATLVGTFRYREEVVGGPSADWTRVGILADHAHPWLSPDGNSVNAQDTACLALAAIVGVDDRVGRLEKRLKALEGTTP